MTSRLYCRLQYLVVLVVLAILNSSRRLKAAASLWSYGRKDVQVILFEAAAAL